MIKSIFICALVFMSAQYATAQEAEEREIFSAPSRIETPSIKFPKIDALRGTEGWVIYNFMVDTKGEVFEPTMIASTGSKMFEKRALNALMKSKYSPANIDGKPVEGSSSMRFSYVLGKSWGGARRPFIKKQKLFVEAINQKNKDEAKKIIDDFKDESKLNNYERAYLNFDRASYAELYGSKNSERFHLNAALSYEGEYDDGAKYFSDELMFSARRQLFVAQLETGRYGEAVKNYHLIVKKHGEDAVSDLNSAYVLLEELRNNEVSYTISAKTNKSGSSRIDLYKSAFSIVNKGSTISEIKLRCEKKYIFFAFKEGDRYDIPTSWGDCEVQVLGAADSEFNLIQY